jgi:hypothetical protein
MLWLFCCTNIYIIFWNWEQIWALTRVTNWEKDNVMRTARLGCLFSGSAVWDCWSWVESRAYGEVERNKIFARLGVLWTYSGAAQFHPQPEHQLSWGSTLFSPVLLFKCQNSTSTWLQRLSTNSFPIHK